MMIRRSGARSSRRQPGGAVFTPASLPNLQLWLRADQGVTLNGSTVSQWNDLSPNGYNVTQGTAGNQPTFVASTAALGGQASFNFVGANTNFMQRASGSTANLVAGPNNVFIVSANDTASGTAWWIDYAGGTTESAMGFVTTGWSIYGGTVVSSVNTSTAAKIQCGVINGASGALYLNNSQTPIITGNCGTHGFDGITIGAHNGAIQPQNGNLAEMIITSGTITTSTIAQVFAYASRRYGFAAS